MKRKTKYEFRLLCLDPPLEKGGFHCMFLEPSEGKALHIHSKLMEQIGEKKLPHIHYVSGLMDNIFVKGNKGCREWSNHISPWVSLDKKVDDLHEQVFYFALDNKGKLLPSNQL